MQSSHQISMDDFEGFIIIDELAFSANRREHKSFFSLTSHGQSPKVTYRVRDNNTRLQWDYDNYGDAILAYNEL